MHQHWTREELLDHWTLRPAERALVDKSRTDHTRLGVAVLLKFFQLARRFPQSRTEVPAPVVAYVAQQLGVPATCFLRYDWSSRMAALHRASILTLLRVREATLMDQQQVTDWLVAQVLPQTQQPEAVRAAFIDRCRALGLEPPTPDRISRHVRSALAISEDHLCTTVLQRLSADTQAHLDELLRVPTPEDTVASRSAPPDRSALADLKRDPGPFGVETVIQEAAKLDRLRQLDLPPDLFHAVPAKLLDRFRQRVVAEELHELRRHPPALRLTLLAAYYWRARQELTDTLAELFMTVIQHITLRAERRVERTLLHELKRVTGKSTLLFTLAEAALAHPDELVRTAIYPVAGEQTLRDLVNEYKATGPAYRQQVYSVMRLL